MFQGLSDVEAGLSYLNMGGTPPGYITQMSNYRNAVAHPEWYGYRTNIRGKYMRQGEFTPLRSGLDYIPFDNYPALLHKGEEVVTSYEAREGNKAEQAMARLLESILSEIKTQQTEPLTADDIGDAFSKALNMRAGRKITIGVN